MLLFTTEAGIFLSGNGGLKKEKAPGSEALLIDL